MCNIQRRKKSPLNFKTEKIAQLFDDYVSINQKDILDLLFELLQLIY